MSTADCSSSQELACPRWAGSSAPIRLNSPTTTGSREAADEAAGGMAIVTSVMRVQQIFASEVESVLKPIGLTFARYEVLMLLEFSRSGQLPLGKIGERLQVHPASVTNAVNRLESDGLVTRTPNPGDGRSTLASVTTDTGREIAASASTALNEGVFGAVRAHCCRATGCIPSARQDPTHGRGFRLTETIAFSLTSN